MQQSAKSSLSATSMSGSLLALLALSAAGMVLLPAFGLLLRLQPAFVHGLRVAAHSAERNCYLCAACYAGVFLVTCSVLCGRACARRKAERASEDHSATDATLTATATGEPLHGKKRVANLPKQPPQHL